MKLINALVWGGLFSTVLFSQEGPNAPTLFYPGAHVVADQIPTPYLGQLAWFLVQIPGVPAYLSESGTKFTLDARSISVTLNGRVLTAKCEEYNETGCVNLPSSQLPDYGLIPLNDHAALIVLNPAVYHVGDKVRVSYSYVSN